jgi:hypothetical protein
MLLKSSNVVCNPFHVDLSAATTGCASGIYLSPILSPFRPVNNDQTHQIHRLSPAEFSDGRPIESGSPDSNRSKQKLIVRG